MIYFNNLKISILVISLILILNIFKVNSTENFFNDKKLLGQLKKFVDGNKVLTKYITDLSDQFDKLQQRCKFYGTDENYNDYSEDLDGFNEQDLESNDWVVIQRRQDGSENFYRNWSDYKNGFGNDNGEFFIGLQKLHELTNTDVPTELLFVLEDFDNQRRYAKYDYFAIGAESENYMITDLGLYSGTAGDSFSYHYGQKFSTKDKENDQNRLENCAQQYKGAWWYNACHRSNLNGRYLNGKIGQDNFGQGIHWNTFRGLYYSLKFVEIKIRPVTVYEYD